MEAVRDWAKEICTAAPLSLRAAKQAIDSGYDRDLEAGLALETRRYLQLLNTKDRLEGWPLLQKSVRLFITVNRMNYLIDTPSREPLPLPVTGLVLCGGRSRRMGRPKAFLPYEGTTMVESILSRMTELFSEVLIVANEPDAYEDFDVDVVKDILLIAVRSVEFSPVCW